MAKLISFHITFIVCNDVKINTVQEIITHARNSVKTETSRKSLNCRSKMQRIIFNLKKEIIYIYIYIYIYIHIYIYKKIIAVH